MTWRLKAKLVRWFNSWLICTNIRRILACTPSKNVMLHLFWMVIWTKITLEAYHQMTFFFPQDFLTITENCTCTAAHYRLVHLTHIELSFQIWIFSCFLTHKQNMTAERFWMYNQKCSVLFGNMFQSLHIQYFYVHILFCFLRMGGKWT